jgi:hypothetical protein
LNDCFIEFVWFLVGIEGDFGKGKFSEIAEPMEKINGVFVSNIRIGSRWVDIGTGL